MRSEACVPISSPGPTCPTCSQSGKFHAQDYMVPIASRRTRSSRGSLWVPSLGKKPRIVLILRRSCRAKQFQSSSIPTMPSSILTMSVHPYDRPCGLMQELNGHRPSSMTHAPCSISGGDTPSTKYSKSPKDGKYKTC